MERIKGVFNPMRIPLSKVYMDDETKAAVNDVLDSGWYILGEETEKFEKEFSKYIGTKYAVAVSSGTAAIQLILDGLNIRKGDEILTVPHTAFPTIEPILYRGAVPVFIDIKSDTYLMNPKKINKEITDNTKAIIPVHLYGQPADMDEIKDVVKDNDIYLIEDCCQAHGAIYNNKKVGSIGDVGCFSFYPSKNMTVCGDGGIITTNNEELYEKIKMLRNHGRTKKYVHEYVGHNLRFNEIQAAIGRIQLKHLPKFIEQRRKIAKMYCNLLNELPITLPIEKDYSRHVYHLFVIRSLNRDDLIEWLKNNGIQTGIHYPLPLHQQPAVKNYVIKYDDLSITEKICKEILSLPMHPQLSDDDVNYVCDKIQTYFKPK